MKTRTLAEDKEANLQMVLRLKDYDQAILAVGNPGYIATVLRYGHDFGVPGIENYVGKYWRCTTSERLIEKVLNLGLTLDKVMVKAVRYYGKQLQRTREAQMKTRLKDAELEAVGEGVRNVLKDFQDKIKGLEREVLTQ